MKTTHPEGSGAKYIKPPPQAVVVDIIYHKTREIVHFAITQNPCREFVRQQLIEFEQTLNGIVYMIHDNAAQFNLTYLAYGIKETKTSVKAPNMNAVAERFIGSARREALDYFLLFNENQIVNILKEYIDYLIIIIQDDLIKDSISRFLQDTNPKGKDECLKFRFSAVYVIIMKGLQRDG